jgi:ketosteroid isomerase-like protein
MAPTNVELLREAFLALDREGVEGILPYIHPEFETTTPASLTVEPDTYRGPDGVRRYFDSFYEVMDEVRFVPEEMLDAGDRVMAMIRLVARSRATGLTLDQHMAMVWTLRNGQAVALETVATREEGLRAAGLEAG